MVGPLQTNPGPKAKPKQDLPPILQGDALPPPSEPKKVEKPVSASGFIENALDDAWDLAKGLYEIIPSTVKSYQENVPYIFKNSKYLTPGMVGTAAKETAKQMGEAIIQPYKEHGAKVVYQRPVTVVSDLITVLTLGGGSIKNAGKLAKASASKAGNVAGIERAQRLIEAGKWLEELPSQMARKGIDATVKTATGGKLDLPKRREFLRLKGEEQGRRILKIEQDAKNVLEKLDGLTPEEKAVFHNARVRGDIPGYGVPDASIPPKVKGALDAYSDFVNRVDDTLADPGLSQFYKSRGMLDEATAETALAKKFALEAFDDVSDAAVAKAKGLIDQARKDGRRLPVYGQNVFIDDMGKGFSGEALLNDMMTGGKKMREGKINPLEALKGAKGYTKDPSIYAREMIKTFREVEAKSRLSERLLENKALIKGGASGMTPDSIPEGIHRKYYEDKIRAEALKSITDPTIQRLLKWEYVKNNSSLIRLYDRIHGLFARSATMWNPKWVTGNVVGDAVLGLLAGSDWVDGMRQLKRGNMPAQIAAKNVTLSTQDLVNPKSGLAKAVSYLPERAADVAGYIDQATRAGIISKDAGRRLKEAALSFEGSAVTLEQVLRSTDRFSDVQVQMRLLAERIERGDIRVQKRSRIIAKLEAREQALHAKLLSMEQSKQGATASRVDPLIQKAEQIEARVKDMAPSITSWSDEYKNWPEWQEAQKLRARAVKARDKGLIGAAGQLGFERGMEKLQDIRQRIVNLTKENQDIIRDLLDDSAKRGDLERLVPGLQAQVDIVRPAVERANAFVGDYLSLDGFEQGVVRRIIPFYPWAKAMSMLAFRLPFLAPVKTFAWNRFSDALATLTQDPELPDDYKGRVPVAITKDGKSVWVKLTTYSPFESLKTSQVAGIPVPGMFNLAQRNPFIGLAYEFSGGKTIFDASSIPYGEQMVSIGDGTVLRVKPNGKIEREIPQTPLVSGVMNMFPTVQLMQQVLQPYWTNKYNWAGMPEPILNSDGSYKYPKELWDRLGAAIGLNVQTRSREEIIRSRKMKAIKNIREMRSQFKRADPDERDFLRQAMQDYMDQEMRGGKK